MHKQKYMAHVNHEIDEMIRAQVDKPTFEREEKLHILFENRKHLMECMMAKGHEKNMFEHNAVTIENAELNYFGN